MEPKKSQLCNCDKKQFFELKEGWFYFNNIIDVKDFIFF